MRPLRRLAALRRLRTLPQPPTGLPTVYHPRAEWERCTAWHFDPLLAAVHRPQPRQTTRPVTHLADHHHGGRTVRGLWVLRGKALMRNPSTLPDPTPPGPEETDAHPPPL